MHSGAGCNICSSSCEECPKGGRNALEGEGNEKVKNLNCLVPPPAVDLVGSGRT